MITSLLELNIDQCYIIIIIQNSPYLKIKFIHFSGNSKTFSRRFKDKMQQQIAK